MVDAPRSAYPLHLHAHLDGDLGRWRWLIKWFLAIPHVVVTPPPPRRPPC